MLNSTYVFISYWIETNEDKTKGTKRKINSQGPTAKKAKK